MSSLPGTDLAKFHDETEKQLTGRINGLSFYEPYVDDTLTGFAPLREKPALVVHLVSPAG